MQTYYFLMFLFFLSFRESQRVVLGIDFWVQHTQHGSTPHLFQQYITISCFTIAETSHQHLQLGDRNVTICQCLQGTACCCSCGFLSTRILSFLYVLLHPHWDGAGQGGSTPKAWWAQRGRMEQLDFSGSREDGCGISFLYWRNIWGQTRSTWGR